MRQALQLYRQKRSSLIITFLHPTRTPRARYNPHMAKPTSLRILSPIAFSTLAAAVALAVAAAPSRPADDKAPDANVIVVKVQNLTLIPEVVTITVGQTVRWTNNDDRDYLLVARDQSFNSGNIRPKEKFDHKFKEAGSYEYGCAIHPRLIGTVVVEEKK